jgi:REP element-mobilizing transposase RayT
MEDYLDRCHGSCLLRQPDVAKLVDDAIRFYHGDCYELLAWVVMPNHVHVLFKTDAIPLSKIISTLKRYTAREINKRLKRRGQLWAEDYWDTYMRDTQHELRTRTYIENNPVKACFVRDSREWPWSSSRFLDAYGVLKLS